MAHGITQTTTPETIAPLIEEQPHLRRVGPFAALSNVNFRYYFVGQVISVSGTWMQNVAQGYLVFNITQSELWLGIVACAIGLPQILLSPLTGVVVERFDRRKLLMMTNAFSMCLAFILAFLTITEQIQVWHIVTLAFLLGCSNTIDAPTRLTFVQEIVGRDLLQSGIQLTSVINSTGRALGPTIAGIVLVQVGAAWCFLVNGLSFLVVLACLFMLKVIHPMRFERTGTSLIQKWREGLSFARHHRIIAPLLILTATVGFFGLPLIQMFPAFADTILNSPKEGYAAISAAEGVGAVVAGILVGSIAARVGQGRWITITSLFSPIIMMLLALQVTIPLAVIFTCFSGFFLVSQVVTMNTLLQVITPEHYRGRVLAIYTLCFFGFAPFGSLILGAIADRIGVSAALILYGAISVCIALMVRSRWSQLSHQRIEAETDVPITAE